MGYRTVAINTVFDGSNLEPKKGKKKKKDETQGKQGDIVPGPRFRDIIKVKILI